MAEILEFPSRQAQGLAFLDRELRALLAARGADQRLIDFAVSQLTRTYAQLSESEQYSFTVELPASIDAAGGTPSTGRSTPAWRGSARKITR